MSSATATSTRENVLYEKKGAIAYVTLNRPKVLNALNKATIAELAKSSTTPVTMPRCAA